MIKDKLGKRRKNKFDDTSRRKRNILNMLEYYEYDADDEQERDARANERETKAKDDKISNENNEMLTRGEYRLNSRLT